MINIKKPLTGGKCHIKNIEMFMTEE